MHLFVKMEYENIEIIAKASCVLKYLVIFEINTLLLTQQHKYTHKIMRSITSLLLGVFLLCLAPNSLLGQVTMGLSESPETGALLQLKDKPKEDGKLVNATRGLLLPRVKLTDVSQLFPMFPANYDKGKQDLVHTGLLVFNTNETLKYGDGAGTYVWDGAKWIGVGLVKRSISISPRTIYLSEVKPELNSTLTTSLKDLPWEATLSGVEGSSTFERTQDGNSYIFKHKRVAAKPGNLTYTYALTNNPDRKAEITVCNLDLTINKDLIKVGEGANGNVSSASIVSAIGGDANWEIASYSTDVFNWDIKPKNEGGKLTFQLGTAKKPGNVDGQIVVRHVNEPGLTRTIKIRQNSEYVILPQFDYIVVRYQTVYKNTSGSNFDVDTATEIKGTGNSEVDGKAVGYIGDSPDGSKVLIRQVGSLDFLNFGGDNTTKGYETAYVNMKNLNKILGETGPRELFVYTNATWWSSDVYNNDAKNKIDLRITVYKGGQMEPVRTYDYENKTATDSLTLKRENIPVTTQNSIHGSHYNGGYTPLYKLEYDRIDNTGVLEPIVPNAAGLQMMMAPSASEHPTLEVLPYETKEEYTKRADVFFKPYYEKLKAKKKDVD